MPILSELMVRPDLNLLKALYREPAVTAYNRLEPRPRTAHFERSLRAEVRDALWFLTRQWQMGELEAEDAGSPIDARLVTQQIHIDRIALQQDEGRMYNEMIPMETFVEREAVPFTLALKVQLSQYFLQLHSAPLKTKYLPKYRATYALEKNQELAFKGQKEGLSLYLATQNRSLDGARMYRDMLDNSFKSKVPVERTDESAMEEMITRFTGWFERQYAQPVQSSDKAWNAGNLSYSCTIGAPDSPQSQVILRSDHYYQGRLDWYDFDEDLQAAPMAVDGQENEPTLDPPTAISFIPTSGTFKGMPLPRFWQMEERDINFGKLNAKTTDHLLLLFAEFGLIYANDWFVIPYQVPVNTLCKVTGFVVTDVFGDRTLIQAANEGPDNEWQHWSMFNQSNVGHMGTYNHQFFLPSTLTQSLESDPIEQVNFIRDEMANMVWGIEDIIPDDTGKGIDGYQAADKTGVTPVPITDTTANIRYVLGTTVPENWIPFLPVQIPGSHQDIQFQRAAMPKLGVPPKEVVKAKGVLLQEVQPLYFIREEEIPYSGTLVKRTYQRTRWYDGRTYVWIGRQRETGRGEGSSKLRFDQIEAVNPNDGR